MNFKISRFPDSADLINGVVSHMSLEFTCALDSMRYSTASSEPLKTDAVDRWVAPAIAVVDVGFAILDEVSHDFDVAAFCSYGQGREFLDVSFRIKVDAEARFFDEPLDEGQIRLLDR
eukprot:CAMPEP_0170170996 /NCGR_PEP_ID=MMETSP0040_2-20121228/4047_1 /TAXON_ID=641309 /ORGANISM="Lotharella oceanica, Strain CCMP622" /LENGTH=117 /DNA_ID=CAMNT_0010410757 /DNA_START=447 /DNA_END=799 /DNA_ORIENTATION=-